MIDRPEEFSDEADEDDSPFCECNLEHTIEEVDFNVCDACGRPIQ